MSVVKVNIQHAVDFIKNDDDILPENKDLIFKFQRYLEIAGYSYNRIYKYLSTLRILAKHMNVPFDKATKEDVENLVLWSDRRRKISDTTKLHYRIMLKAFYKWIHNGEIAPGLEYPECAKFIKVSEKNNHKKLPKDMLTVKDIKKLLAAAVSPRDKAFIAMLWETGARIEEIMNLTVGDLEDHKYGMKLVVNGKTGARRLMLVESVPYIHSWLRSHPGHDDKKAPLWVNIGVKNSGKAVKYEAMRKMLWETGKRAGINKPFNPHNFRHSRATYMANYFTEAQMCEWFGWVQGSDIPARYVHLSGRDIDNAYARMYGIKEREDEEGPKVEFIKCPRCGYDNANTFKFCGRCGMALDLQAALEAEDRDKQVGAELVEAIRNPIVQKKILKALEEIITELEGDNR